MTRRKFLRLAGKILLALNLPLAWLGERASAATGSIRYLRQIITADATTSRTIMWESTTPLKNLAVELTPNSDSPVGHGTTSGKVASAAQSATASAASEKIIVPATCKSLTLDGTTNYYYTATLTGLAPGSTYRYRVVETTAAGARADAQAACSSSYTLSTAGVDSPAFSALIFADTQCGNSYDLWRDNLAVATRRHPSAEFMAIVGDLTDNGEDSWHWESFWQAMADAPARLPLAPVMGNHECYGLDWKFTLPQRYLASFTLPDNASDKFRGYYYSYDYGAVHFVVLNTQMLELAEWHDGFLAAQLEWLRVDLAASDRSWQVVMMHKDILAYDEWQAGSQSTGGISDVGRVFMDVFAELGIDLVLTGHMHTYRKRELGPLYIMSGPSGNESYTVPADPLDKKSIRQPTPPNYILLTATNRELTITDYTFSGELIDRNILTK